MIVRIGLDWSKDQSCFRLSLKHFLFVYIKCEALTFHVDCSVRRNLLAVPSTSSFMWVRTAEIGSRCFTCSMGSDLSQPTSTSNTQNLRKTQVSCIIPPASFLVRGVFRSNRLVDSLDSEHAKHVLKADRATPIKHCPYIAYIFLSCSLRIFEPPTRTLMIPL